MTNPWAMILPLALGTFAIRLAGALLGQRIPTHGAWARAMRALPGCLIVSLVAIGLVSGGFREWAAGLAAGLARTGDAQLASRHGGRHRVGVVSAPFSLRVDAGVGHHQPLGTVVAVL